MDNIINGDLSSSNQMINIALLLLAAMRIWLEIMGFDFNSLPMTKGLARMQGKSDLNSFHRMGLVFSIGYIVLFAPSVFF
ncbi:hypothetical protein HBN50_08370 [Halobacteriovorax sp. GB3]|uniref:hypothetical protein n=1 Tax=Halobacteriovorax sp. GB3 TaxID=2719615 RepID=UPI00236178F4|nr:hypothetical protein [Halobacteriovorax sp. GB3]MDD0853108.1 hypothetical protein [Halobacteriovorax sp. GB3]